MMLNEFNICIVIPVHNRKETTLACLRTLRAQGVMQWSTVIVVDDGSNDGTSYAILAAYSKTEVVVLKGDGDLWWAGGINLGMKYAVAQGADFIIWLNDDCTAEEYSLERLVNHSIERHVISVGQAWCPSGHYYGGHKKTLFGLKLLRCPEGEVLPCDSFGGNAVCIPRCVVDKIGFLDAELMPMVPADADYGLRATTAGITAEVLGDAKFLNQDNLTDEHQSWLLGDINPRQVWESFSSKRSSLSFKPQLYYRWRHWHLWGLVLYVFPYVKFLNIAFIRFVLPIKFLRRVYGKYSGAWRIHQFHDKCDG
jgi:GT2 family glycosyltransferase